MPSVGERYKLIFANGLFSLTTPVNQEWASGHFSAAGGQTSFAEQDVGPDCQPREARFTRRWAFSGMMLTSSLFSDPLNARQHFLTVVP